MASHQELSTLAQNLRSNHGSILAEVACMAYLSRRLLTEFAKAHCVDPTSLLSWQQRVVFGYTTSQGIPDQAMVDAMEALEQAGETAAYLDSLPS